MNIIWIVGMSLIFSGCGSLFPKPGESPRLGVLSPETHASPDWPRLDVHLAIDIPSGGGGYDTSRIPYAQNATSLDYFAGIEWTDRIPFLVQNAILRAFENSQKVLGVARAAAGINPDVLLMIDIRKFLVAQQSGVERSVEIEVCAKLVDMERRKIEDQILLRETQNLEFSSPKDIIQSFNLALGRVLDRLVEWTLRDAVIGLKTSKTNTDAQP